MALRAELDAAVRAEEVVREIADGAAEAVRPVATLAVPVAVPVAVTARVPVPDAAAEEDPPICWRTAGEKVPVIPVRLRSNISA